MEKLRRALSRINFTGLDKAVSYDHEQRRRLVWMVVRDIVVSEIVRALSGSDREIPALREKIVDVGLKVCDRFLRRHRKDVGWMGNRQQAKNALHDQEGKQNQDRIEQYSFQDHASAFPAPAWRFHSSTFSTMSWTNAERPASQITA